MTGLPFNSLEQFARTAEAVAAHPVRDSGQRGFAWPSSFNFQKKLLDWCMVDAGIPVGTVTLRDGQVDQRDRARREADEVAYAEGWAKAATELWQLAVVSL